MSKKQVIILWIIAIVLAVAAVVVRSGGSKGFDSHTDRKRGETLFKELPITQVAKIEISSGDAKVTVSRKDGKWTVAERENYPARTSTVNELLRTLAEVKVTDGIEADPSFAPRFGMNPSATEESERGTEVVLSDDAGSEIARVTLGKNIESAGDPMSPFGGGSSGRFIRNHADTSGVYKVSELFSSLTTEPRRWLDDSFLRVEKITGLELSKPGKPDETEWKLTRPDENSDFTLEGKADNEALEPSTVNPLKSIFSASSFEDVVNSDQVAGLEDADAKRTLKITTAEGFRYTLTIAPAKPEKTDEEEDSATPSSTTSYLLTVSLEAELAAERKKEEGESEEDAKAKDKAFADRKAELEKRIEATKALEGRVFKVSNWTVDAILKDRSALVQKAADAGTQAPPPATHSAPAKRPVEAVTPPIAIPPLDADTKDENADEEDGGNDAE